MPAVEAPAPGPPAIIGKEALAPRVYLGPIGGRPPGLAPEVALAEDRPSAGPMYLDRGPPTAVLGAPCGLVPAAPPIFIITRLV